MSITAVAGNHMLRSRLGIHCATKTRPSALAAFPDVHGVDADTQALLAFPTAVLICLCWESSFATKRCTCSHQVGHGRWRQRVLGVRAVVLHAETLLPDSRRRRNLPWLGGGPVTDRTLRRHLKPDVVRGVIIDDQVRKSSLACRSGLHAMSSLRERTTKRRSHGDLKKLIPAVMAPHGGLEHQ
jgi:hypothetical protein